jgi:hypothetical protein
VEDGLMRRQAGWIGTIGAAAALASLCLAGGKALTAAEPASLPTFDLVGPEGETTTSVELAGAGPWVLVCVRPTSGPSRALLKALHGRADARTASRLVVLVDGTADELRGLREANPDLAASWYADPAHQALRQLALQGVPTVFGLRGTQVAWTLQGSLGSRQLAAIEGWLGRAASTQR